MGSVDCSRESVNCCQSFRCLHSEVSKLLSVSGVCILFSGISKLLSRFSIVISGVSSLLSEICKLHSGFQGSSDCTLKMSVDGSHGSVNSSQPDQ